MLSVLICTIIFSIVLWPQLEFIHWEEYLDFYKTVIANKDFYFNGSLLLIHIKSQKHLNDYTLQYSEKWSRSVVPDSAIPWIVACTKLLCPWDFQGKSTGVGCHFLLQGIFPTQGSNPGLSHCRQTLYRLNHQGSLYLKNVF